jgi:ketosteroid isomerase-like protein
LTETPYRHIEFTALKIKSRVPTTLTDRVQELNAANRLDEMRSDPEGIVEASLTAYALGDYETAAAFYSPDAIFTLNDDDELFPFDGEWKGREAIVSCWHEIGETFDVLRFEPHNISAAEDVIRCQIRFELRHRASGEVMDSIARCVFEVQNGLIVREREYNDVERLRAFMRLCGHSSRVKAKVIAKQP